MISNAIRSEAALKAPAFMASLEYADRSTKINSKSGIYGVISSGRFLNWVIHLFHQSRRKGVPNKISGIFPNRKSCLKKKIVVVHVGVRPVLRMTLGY
ncbi:MAG: hypothetical protein LC657_13110, partial [Desulfobacteraceae bacterium]|nr:hypothetical protein [Desulfobacteraceae bacterium]